MGISEAADCRRSGVRDQAHITVGHPNHARAPKVHANTHSLAVPVDTAKVQEAYAVTGAYSEQSGHSMRKNDVWIAAGMSFHRSKACDYRR